ncbi:hypothetical protein P7K49_025168 [Saguinus oedipus]|uniref:UBZ1-type domain-containing protein n=1 Tax=Saguinus oedipus TaxID=9490 RepID=A0ABQ9UGC1_SAGOE|nr:hypothetical protein P7K49_025168 [Saguinus oedipus]
MTDLTGPLIAVLGKHAYLVTCRLPSVLATLGHVPLVHDMRAANCCFDVHKKCPLCELMFPPNYDQSKFEEHVESHWKVCPMCSEQFPPDYDQQVFERHVQTHFDQNVLNFD